jgi:hypothetical protein
VAAMRLVTFNILHGRSPPIESAPGVPSGASDPGPGLASGGTHISEFRLEAEQHLQRNLAAELPPTRHTVRDAKWG